MMRGIMRSRITEARQSSALAISATVDATMMTPDQHDRDMTMAIMAIIMIEYSLQSSHLTVCA